eukprot:TRINITY_DN12445_c0_g2_i4.p2 TRINITY_DN12445_c0_g2~~TRINITY_DN12445_c0_g2_i4.p2  ORF type:complete len:105 (+),score=31.28 TRINITY_DN12445_c0_g2_i4:268-582(+)
MGWLLSETPKRIEEDMQYKALLKDKTLSAKPREHKGLRMRRQKKIFKMFYDRMNKKCKEEGKNPSETENMLMTLLSRNREEPNPPTSQERLKDGKMSRKEDDTN